MVNIVYGHAPRRRQAIEVQNHASNSMFTVNLLVNTYCVSHMNIIPGASNLSCFCEQEEYFGNPIVKSGDIAVMDNCGFHHGRNTILRNMLAVRGFTVSISTTLSPAI